MSSNPVASMSTPTGVHQPTLPKGIYLELTDLCNLTCPMCRDGHFKGSILPLETYREIAEALFPHAVFVDLRGWGESTLLPNFEAYLDIALGYPIQIKLITNAALTKPHLWQRLGQAGVTVGVSFDAADQETFSKIRPGANIDRILNNVNIINEAYRDAEHDPARGLYFCITAGGQNIHQLPDIIRLGEAHGVRRFKIEPLFAPEGHPDRLENHRDQIRQSLAEVTAFSQEQGLTVELSASLLAEDTIVPATQKICVHPWDYLYVNARGRLGFCDHLNGQEEFTFATWQKGHFQEFWNGPQMTALRSEHLQRLNGQAITTCAECNWCYDRRYMDLEDWIHPDWASYRVIV
jgi:radical SAM protein with 4Fe4S-binding SPASM domain